MHISLERFLFRMVNTSVRFEPLKGQAWIFGKLSKTHPFLGDPESVQQAGALFFPYLTRESRS